MCPTYAIPAAHVFSTRACRARHRFHLGGILARCVRPRSALRLVCYLLARSLLSRTRRMASLTMSLPDVSDLRCTIAQCVSSGAAVEAEDFMSDQLAERLPFAVATATSRPAAGSTCTRDLTLAATAVGIYELGGAVSTPERVLKSVEPEIIAPQARHAGPEIVACRSPSMPSRCKRPGSLLSPRGLRCRYGVAVGRPRSAVRQATPHRAVQCSERPCKAVAGECR